MRDANGAAAVGSNSAPYAAKFRQAGTLSFSPIGTAGSCEMGEASGGGLSRSVAVD